MDIDMKEFQRLISKVSDGTQAAICEVLSNAILDNIEHYSDMTGEEAARHIAGIIKSEGEPLN